MYEDEYDDTLENVGNSDLNQVKNKETLRVI